MAKKNILDYLWDIIVKNVGEPLKAITDIVRTIQGQEVEKAKQDPELFEDQQKLAKIDGQMGLLKADTPRSEYIEKMYDSATGTDLKYSTVAGATIIPDLLGGGIGSRTFGLPAWIATINRAVDIYNAPHRFAQMEILKQQWLQIYTPYIPEPYRLGLAAAKGVMLDKNYKEAMKLNGLNENWANIYKEQNFLALPTEFLLQMLRRGVINDAEFHLLSSYAPYDVWTAEKLLGMKDVIPPLTDLILMAVREAFVDGTWEQNLAIMKQWTRKMGLTDEWADRYATAHWERIPLQQAYDNLWRGYWTVEQFKRMLRIKDFHPEDRQAILDVAYRPLSIRELGYAYDVGAVGHDDIVRYRRMGGLSPEDAEVATTALIDYRLNAEREAVRREWLHLFAMEQITEEEFKASLMDLRTPDEAIPLWVMRGELERKRKAAPPVEYYPRGMTRATAQWLFEHGVKDEAWLRQALKDINTTNDAINAYVEQSKQRIEESREKELDPSYRKLSLTQVKDLYKFGVLNDTQLLQALETLGYSPDDAVYVAMLIEQDIIEVYEPKMLTRTDVGRMYDLRVFNEEDLVEYYKKIGYPDWEAAQLTKYTILNNEFPDLKAMYRNGWINATLLVERLAEILRDYDRAAELAMTVIKYEQPARLEKERDLTKTEIIKGAKKGILTPQQAAGLLQDIDYDEAEAWYLLILNDVVERGDPDNYYDMRRTVEMYKKARGHKYTYIPNEVLELESKLVAQRQKIEELKEQGITEDGMAEEIKKREELKALLQAALREHNILPS